MRSSQQSCSTKKLFLKISQYLQEKEPLFNKVAGLQYRCVPENIPKFLRTSFEKQGRKAASAYLESLTEALKPHCSILYDRWRLRKLVNIHADVLVDLEFLSQMNSIS